MVYEVTETDGRFFITSDDKTIPFSSTNGAEIHKWIIDHEGTYYIRSTRWQEDIINVSEPK